MTITIKYFGALAEITQKKEEQFRFELPCISVASLKENMEARYQEMENTTYSVAVNQKMSDMQTQINDGDILAFLPPFAGG